jgi:hypothetical protein
MWQQWRRVGHGPERLDAIRVRKRGPDGEHHGLVVDGTDERDERRFHRNGE